MRLYSGTSQEFIQDALQNQIADKLKTSYESYYGRGVSPGEFSAWGNSLQFLKNLVESSDLKDNMLILEYELPYANQRIDCILLGAGKDGAENVVVIELKQWSKVKDCDVEGNVMTFVGNAERMVEHPSLQVAGYHAHLKDFLKVFEESPPLSLASCVYMHNYSAGRQDLLLSQKFADVVKEFPVYTKNDFQSLSGYLKERLSGGRGLEIFNRFINSPIRPSRKLIEHAHDLIKGQSIFHLIDEQIAANNAIIDRAKKCAKSTRKSVIIVKGGPGTGKSVIALNALAELLSKGITVFHATGSAAFTKTLRKIVGTRLAKLFKFFNSFTQTKENELGVLICDEAHRIRKTSQSWYNKVTTGLSQIEEIIRSAKVCIFFIDDYQIVRPEEIGSTPYIKEAAQKFGAEIFEFELKTQFRCSGSDGYLNWVDNALQIRDTANRILTKNEKMEFKIFDSPHKLYEEIKKKNSGKPNSARLVAGFCWKWNDPNPDGTLKDDVVIGNFKMPWEAKEGKKVAKGIPPASLWAYDPNGVNQVGSIYTIQGFEFDYVGVIFGNDLKYDPATKTWIGKPTNSADPMVKRAQENFTQYVKNVYRVLLTRGMKGCYVYFIDKDTEEFFRSRTAN
jgi:hypothetical protein